MSIPKIPLCERVMAQAPRSHQTSNPEAPVTPKLREARSPRACDLPGAPEYPCLPNFPTAPFTFCYVRRAHAAGTVIGDSWLARRNMDWIDWKEAIGSFFWEGEGLLVEDPARIAVVNNEGHLIATALCAEDLVGASGISTQYAESVLDLAGIKHQAFAKSSKSHLARLALATPEFVRRLLGAISNAPALSILGDIVEIGSENPVLAAKLSKWLTGHALPSHGSTRPTLVALKWIAKVASHDKYVEDLSLSSDHANSLPAPAKCTGLDGNAFESVLCFKYQSDEVFTEAALQASEIGKIFPKFSIDQQEKRIHCGYQSHHLVAMNREVLHALLYCSGALHLENHYGHADMLARRQDERLSLLLACFQALSQAPAVNVDYADQAPLSPSVAAQTAGQKLWPGVIFGDTHSSSLTKECLVEFIEHFPVAETTPGSAQARRPTLYLEHIDRGLLDQACTEYNLAAPDSPLPPMLDHVLTTMDNGWRAFAKQSFAPAPSTLTREVVIAAHKKGWRIKALQDFRFSRVKGDMAYAALRDLRNALVNYEGWRTVKEDAAHCSFALLLVGGAHAHTLPGLAQGTPGLAQLLGYPVVEPLNSTMLRFTSESIDNRRPLRPEEFELQELAM